MQSKINELEPPLKKQKLLEQRRKEFTFSSLSSELMLTSIFDFFSPDAFILIAKSKIWAQQQNIEFISSEMLLFNIVRSNLRVVKFLKFYSDANEYMLQSFFAKKESANAQHVKLKQKSNLQGKKKWALLYSIDIIKGINNTLVAFFSRRKKKQEVLLKFSDLCLFLFDKASENSKKRFVTPLISTNILLLTMIEEKQVITGHFFTPTLRSKLKSLILLYKLIKQIYAQEAAIRNQLKYKHFYYLYLLKTAILEKKSSISRQNESLRKKAFLFRLALIKQVLRINRLNYLKGLTNRQLSMPFNL